MSHSVTWNSATDLHVAQVYFSLSLCLFVVKSKMKQVQDWGVVSKALASGTEYKGA